MNPKVISSIRNRVNKNPEYFWAFCLLLYIGFFIGSVILPNILAPVSGQSALAFVSDMAKISATLLAIYSSAFLFLLGTDKVDVRQVTSRNAFAVSFFLFVLAILHSLVSMLFIDPNRTMDLRLVENYVIVLMPVFWMFGAILMIAVLIWILYRAQIDE